MVCLVTYLLLTVFFIYNAHSAKILGVFFIPSVSHEVMFKSIYKELSLRGHQLTVITTDPIKDPTLNNLTEIDVSFLYEMKNVNSFAHRQLSPTYLRKIVLKFSEMFMEPVFKNEKVKSLCANQTENFDLILVEALSPIAYGFAGRFKAPVIGIVSMEGSLNNHRSVGNPTHPALFADFILSYVKKPSIFEKIYNSYYFLWDMIHYEFEVLPRADALARKYLGNDLPYIGDLEKNVSMIFVNTNPVINGIRPMVPSMITLGFIHVKPPKPLPKDLKEILDNAKKGAIYFSLGSNVKSSALPEKQTNAIIQALSELPYTVFWKWESNHVPEVGKNVITRKWFPQQDILAHPNIKVFVTQGGLQSTEEAILRGVPLVGMPFISDQMMNVGKMVELGIAVKVSRTATKDELKSAIIEVASNERYRKKIREIRDIVTDQPMTSLEKAIWWTEYVIRHKGASHLRSPTADIPLYEYLLLDVIATVVGAVLVSVYVIYKLVRILLRFVKSTKKVKRN